MSRTVFRGQCTDLFDFVTAYDSLVRRVNGPHYLSEIRVVTVAFYRSQQRGILLTIAPPWRTLLSMIHRGMAIDDLGNRLTFDENANQTTYGYNVANELTKKDSTQVYYDKNGNLTKDAEGYTYHYDRQNQLTKIKKASDSVDVATYAYDALGRRIEIIDLVADPDVTTRCYYDGDQVIEDTDVSANVQRYYVWGNTIDELLMMHRGSDGADYFAVRNHLFSPVALVKKSDASITERYEYDAYGKVTFMASDYSALNPQASGIDNRYLFTGRELDNLDGNALKVYYYRARYYDPLYGRFLQRDPADYVDGMNLYEYVKSSPVNHSDSSGLWSGSEHSKITQEGWDLIPWNLTFTRGCRNYMLTTVKDGNLAQDTGANFNKMDHHYNRPYKSTGETDTDKQTWDTKYETYLTSALGAFINDVNSKQCTSALTRLGLAMHSIQDFYMHAIRRDGKGGKENSYYDGWKAFSANPPVTGSPFSRGKFWPSSYSLVYSAEHPRTQEPVTKDPEYTARRDGAFGYTSAAWAVFLPEWWNRNNCYCGTLCQRK